MLTLNKRNYLSTMRTPHWFSNISLFVQVGPQKNYSKLYCPHWFFKKLFLNLLSGLVLKYIFICQGGFGKPRKVPGRRNWWWELLQRDQTGGKLTSSSLASSSSLSSSSSSWPTSIFPPVIFPPGGNTS